MAKDLKDMTRQEVHSYFKFKDYRGEQLKVVMAALDYGIDVSYLRLFDDTGIPAEVMENMFTAMKEDYGVEAAAFLSAVSQPENGCIFLEALKSGVPLHELKEIWEEGMLPVELREKILPLMRGREAIPEKIGEKMAFISEAVRELETENKNLHDELLVQRSYAEGLKEKQKAWEGRDAQERQRAGNSPEMENRQAVKRSRKQEGRRKGTETGKQKGFSDSLSFPFIRKKPDLLAKLAGELEAGQIAEIRLGIEDGLTDGQLAILADKAMDAEKIRELRMTMKILNERGLGT